MKNSRIFISVTLIMILLFFLGKLTYYHRFNINFESITSVKVSDSLISSGVLPYWFTLRNNGWYTKDVLPESIQDSEDLVFDFKHYTYVITSGYEMEKLEYSFSNMKNRRKYIPLPKQYIGEIYLNKNYDGMIHFYRIKKIDIDHDYHLPESGVHWVLDGFDGTVTSQFIITGDGSMILPENEPTREIDIEDVNNSGS